MDLKEATHFGQDWGGLVGLRVVAELPDRFARVVVPNQCSGSLTLRSD